MPHPASRAIAVHLAVVALALVAASCRSDSGPSLATWIGKADDICKQAQTEADQTRPVLFEPSLAQTLRRSADYSRSEASQLRDLEKPGEKRAEVREYLATLDERVRQLELLASQAEHPGPDFKPPSLDSVTAATQKASDQATAIGLKVCRAGIDVSIGGEASTTTTAPAAGGAPGTTGPDPNALDNETQDQAG